MKKNTISIAQLTQEILWSKKINSIMESVAGKAGAANSALMSLGKELKQSGLNPTEEETQAALLMAAVQNKGNIEKIEPEDVEKIKSEIKEGRDFILESESVTLMAIEGIGTILGNAALLHALAKGIEKISGKKIDEQKIKQGLSNIIQKVKKITGFPAKAMETFFKFVVRSWGGGELAQEIAGVTGTLFAIGILFALGIATFPSIKSMIMLALSITSLIGKATEIFSLVKHLWHIITNHETDIEKKNVKAVETAVDKEMSNVSKSLGTEK